MRANRVLVAKGWYSVSTDVNNRESVFRLSREVRRLKTVLHEARKIYEFEVRGLRVEDDRVSFYINAVGGFAVILRYRGEPLQKTAPVLKNLKKIVFFTIFLRFFHVRLKQIAYPIALYTVWESFSKKTDRSCI